MWSTTDLSYKSRQVEPSPQDPEAGGSLSLGPLWSTERTTMAIQRNPVWKKTKLNQNKQTNKTDKKLGLAFLDR